MNLYGWLEVDQVLDDDEMIVFRKSYNDVTKQLFQGDPFIIKGIPTREYASGSSIKGQDQVFYGYTFYVSETRVFPAVTYFVLEKIEPED